MDRHFLSLIETHVCIASLDEPLATSSSYVKSTTEALRLILAQKINPPLNFRELPVSLLRLYFSGRQRLTRFISRLPQHRLNTLIHFIEQDGGVVKQEPSLNNNNSNLYTDPVYQHKCQLIENYIKSLLDYCLCSFETTLSRIISGDEWARFGLLESLERGNHWANFPVPDAVKYQREEDQQYYSIYLACVWRINTTLLLCKLLSPWDDDSSKDWVNYQCKLFRDTHLDLLSMMLKKAVYDDESIAVQHRLLRDYYPSCNRVCCAEELPDFGGYATDNFKTGSKLKERSSLDDKIGHLYVNKTGPNICKIRNFYDIIIRYGEEDPIIYDILKNVIKCVLLGNLPHSRGYLNMMARIKINLSFFPDEADVVIPDDVFKELTKNKSMKRSRSKKKVKDELQYTKTRFILWLLLCRHFVLYLLKEFLFYIAESSEWFDELLSVDFKYRRYRDIVLIGNGQCRNKLSQQARTLPLDKGFDWNVIEFEEKSTETYDTKSGEIKKFHAWSLTVARKVQKDDFMKILAKKMTNTEASLIISDSYTPFYYVESRGEVADPTGGKCISIVELHFICWCMSKNKSRIMETRWFQVIGMTTKGIETLRWWLFMYNTYDVPDNSLKELIVEFHKNSATDYMMLKTVIKIIEYYKQDQIFHLPLSYGKKQIYALRRLLGIEDWEATPPLLGFAYQCGGHGCNKFANILIEPIDHSHKQRLLLPSSTTTNNQQQQHQTETKKKGRKRKTPLVPEQQQSTNSKKPAAAAAVATTKTNNNNVISSFLNMALYNMDDGKLYCSKYSSHYKHTLCGENLANGPIIMRKKDNSIIVRSNKTLYLLEDGTPSRTLGLAPMSDKKTSRSKKQSGNSSTMSQAAREREARKFQWLLERRVFELKDTNGDDPLNDDVTCGLFATTAVEEEDEDSANNNTTTTTLPSSSKLTDQTTTTSLKSDKTTSSSSKKDNKKIILVHVNRAFSDMGLTCNKELTCTDMIGVVKNLKVRCTECGSMTEMTNYNNTNHGITCGHHKSVYDSDFDLPATHINPDKQRSTTTTTIVAYKNKKGEAPIILEEQMTEDSPLPITLISALPSHSTLYRQHHHHHYQQTSTHQKLKNQLHPLDIVQKTAGAATSQPGHIEGEYCAYCSTGLSKYRVTGIGHYKQIIKVALCKPCYDVCSGSVLTKHGFPLLSTIYTHLKNKRPL